MARGGVDRAYVRCREFDAVSGHINVDETSVQHFFEILWKECSKLSKDFRRTYIILRLSRQSVSILLSSTISTFLCLQIWSSCDYFSLYCIDDCIDATALVTELSSSFLSIAFKMPEAGRNIRFGLELGCGAMYRSLTLIGVTGTNASVYDQATTHFVTLHRSVLSLLSCPSSVMVPASELLLDTASRSDRGCILK